MKMLFFTIQPPDTYRRTFLNLLIEPLQLNSRSSQTFLLMGATHGTAKPPGKATAVETARHMR